MNKKVLFFVLPALLIAACFIPVTQQKSINIKSPFLNIYTVLSNPVKWEQWRPDLKKALLADSNTVSIQKQNAGFTIKAKTFTLVTESKGVKFYISEKSSERTENYHYTLIPIADKFLNKTTVTADENTNAIKYMIEMLIPSVSRDLHLTDLRNFMEIDSLHYGFNIFGTGVPESHLIVMRKEVLKTDKFKVAGEMLDNLQQYVKSTQAKQLYPVIAQFLSKGKDSTQVNVGLYIDKEVPSAHGIVFTRMPKGGPLYAATFKGKFSKRGLAYEALTQYFSDHSYQTAILPFETYLDNRLPVSDNELVNIQVNFSTYPNGQGR